MRTAKIAISLDPSALRQVDSLVQGGIFPSRSKLIQVALQEKLARITKLRLAHECARLDPREEQAEAEQHLGAEVAWPEY